MKEFGFYNLKGRTALVTGASMGIGRAIARGLMAAGARVVTHGLEESPPDQGSAPAGLFADYIQADLADADACTRLAKEATSRAGSIDVVVLCGAAELRRTWLELSTSDIDRLTAINFRSTVILMQQLLPLMMAQGWGRVVAISSIQEFRPSRDHLVYAALKSAQANLISNFSRIAGPHGVTVNAVSPGAIATGRNAAALANPDFRVEIERQIPLGRIGTPDDCVGACLLLASDAGAYITGTTVRVDGGWSA